MPHSEALLNYFGFLLFSCLLLFLPFEIVAQCGGTYFKRLSTTVVPINSVISATADLTGDGIPDLNGVEENTQQIVRDKFIYFAFKRQRRLRNAHKQQRQW